MNHHPGRSPGRHDPERGERCTERSGDGTGLSSDWAVPWSDLMMVMFVLFAVLFVYEMAERDVADAFDPASADREWAELTLPREPRPLPAGTVYEQSERAVREADLDHVEVVLQDDRSVKLSLGGPMFFDLGTADLKPETREFLHRVADVIRRNNYEIRVVGHTDSFPVSNDRFPTNWELSAIRATTVARYLIEQGGIDPGRFAVVAHSMYQPALPNTSLQNKALNRRVEIVITHREYGATESSGS